MPLIPAQPALTAVQCADMRGEDVAAQAPGRGKHPLAEREASEGTLAGTCQQQLQAADKAVWGQY